jgi:replicative DNA helicase Mcm
MAQAANNELVETFEQFFRDYYRDDIGDLARGFPTDRRSLYVDWQDLYRFDPDLADDYLSHPEDFREKAEEALRLYDLPVDVKLGGAHVRLCNLPETTPIRDLRSRHVNSLIAVNGLVRKATDVRPKIQNAAFECQRCGTLTRVRQGGPDFHEPHECQGCERQGPFQLNVDQSEFVDAQSLRVQESPEGLQGGETPRSIDVRIEDDLTGEVTPGDQVTVTGVLRIDQSESGENQSAVFDTYMEGIAVEIEDEEFEDMEISEEDKKEIVRLSENDDIYEQMVRSIAPSIYGYEEQKLAMGLQLFSGVTKHLPDGTRLRGDLHILFIGDPGTGKSQMLQYIQKISPRSVYSSGKGSSAAGLTAAAVRDDFGDGQQWSLEAGALVLADRGIAAIDELDKMEADDRSAMHEALEQQSYHPDTEVLLADGRRVEIGEFVDERMAEADEVVDGVDCEIVPVEDAAVHSVDVEAGETTKLPVDRVSRHEAPEEFVRVTFSNGREVTVTPEHPMFVAGEGIDTVEAREIEAGAFVPAPRKLPNSSAAVELDGEPTRGKEKDVSLPGELTPELAEALGFLVAEGHSYAGSAHEIGFSNQDERLLSRMDRLMSEVFGVESSDNVNAAGTVTKRWTSTKLYRWFEANFSEVMATARDKRIPARVLGASEEVIRRFLVGAFAGDGGVESEAMSYSTASEGLATDYADALSKVGVASRIHHDDTEDSWKVHVMGDSTERFVDAVVDPADDRYERAREFVERSNETPRHHDVLPTEAARDRPDALEDRTDLRYYRVTEVETVPNEGEAATEWVYDVTVEPTNTFVSQGVVLHNSISISKAGINATLKSRCSLLGAANPKYGRFDQYEPIGEQIDLEPALISRFDLIFTVTDKPDEEEDRRLADHILTTNYAGELNTQREEMTSPDVSREEVESFTDEVDPDIDPTLFRKYVAYAKQTCHPRMTEPAREAIKEFYTDLRAKGTDEDAPVPVTARQLEAIVRLAEASARVRLSDQVTEADADRVIELVRSCLQDVGVDPESGEFDADVVETGTSKSQRDRIKNIKGLIAEIEAEYEDGAPVEVVLDRADEIGLDPDKADHEIDKLKQKGEVYEPSTDHLRTT